MTERDYLINYQLVLNDINENDLEKAYFKTNSLINLCEDTLKHHQFIGIENLSNEWLIRILSVSFIKNYIEYFDCLSKKIFRESWDVLQSCRKRLELLRKYRRIYQIIDLDYLEKRLESFEKLYPFNMFLSVGAKFKKVTCSICGNYVSNSKCTHIMGNLYNGEIATRLLEEATILEVSVVDKPYDRCCIAEPDGGYSNTWKEIFEHLIRIEGLITFDFNVIEHIKDDNGVSSIDPDMKCYCNSRKAFIECCWTKVKYKNRYLHLELCGYQDLKPNFNIV